MRRLQTRLILAFVGSTLIPVAVTIWVSLSLLDRSLNSSAIRELDETSQALARTGREYYLASRTLLELRVARHELKPEVFSAGAMADWPAEVRDFHDSGAPSDFVRAGNHGDQLDYLVRRGGDVLRYSAPLNGVAMGQLSDIYKRGRAVLNADARGDLRRGLFGAFLLVSIAVWLASLALLVWWAHRISTPIRQLTTGLAEVAAGN